MLRIPRTAFIFILMLALVAGLACQAVYQLPEWFGQGVSPQPEAEGTLLYEEDFSENLRGWDEETESDDFGEVTKGVVDGAYRISMTAKGSFFFEITSVPDFSGKDFLLSLDVSVLKLNAAPGDLTLQFSLREAEGITGKHYAFQFYNDGTFDGEVWSSGSYESAMDILGRQQNEALTITSGFSKTFAIRAEGNTFTLYLDGEELAQVSDATIDEPGQISLNLSLDQPSQSVVIEFDNLVIYALP